MAQKGYTQWSIVYDQRRGRIHFRSLAGPAVKTVETKVFDYSCASAVKMLDINTKETGDVTAKFVDYTGQANRELIERSFGGTEFLKSVPAAAKDFIAAYPEPLACESPATKAENERPAESEGFFGYLAALYRFFFGA